MKISIITVVYNNASTIADTIKSVNNQTYKNIEYIIIDGASTDGTLDIIRSSQHNITKLISEPDKGLYHAMNKGIALATGDIIGILNADDIYESKDSLSQVIQKFKETDADAVYGNLVYVDAHDIIKVIRKWEAGEYKPNAFKMGWMPPHPAFFTKKNIYSTFGNFNTELKIAADYELMLRLIHKNNIKLSYLSKTIVRMRIGGISNSGLYTRIKVFREDILAWKLNGLKPSYLTLIMKRLSKISQFILR